MSGWPILDVAIGLAFLYLLLSTICTALTEGITTQLRSRAKYLERGIATLLGSGATTPASDAKDAKSKEEVKLAQGEAAKEAFYSHPLIQSFTHGHGDSVLRKVVRKLTGKKDLNADKRPSYLPGDKFAAAVLSMRNESRQDGSALYPELQKTVANVIKAAGATNYEEEVKALQLWYDQVMERVSGWYKRHTQAWVRFLAIVVVVGLNADTLKMADMLWKDPTLRQEVVEQAKARLKQPPPETAAIEYSDADETLPDEPPAEIGKPGDSSDKYYGLTSEQWQTLQQFTGWEEDSKELDRLQDEADAQNLQAGNAAEAARNQNQPPPKEPEKQSIFCVYLGWFGFLLKRHFVGWFITVVAVSLGAPFWYNLLNRLVNIRNAGQPPASEAEKTEKKK